jgi:Uma2 family endonuclease
MEQTARTTPLTAEAYLELEKTSEVKHQFVAGEVFAMVGASLKHASIVLELGMRLHAALKGRPCRVFTSDVKVRIDEADAFYYPDVVVTCDEGDLSRTHHLERPKLVIEVLSPSTASFDRGMKLDHYQLLDSLQEYVLVHQDEPRAVRMRRTGDATWSYEIVTAGGHLTLETVGVDIALDALYADL